MKLKSLTPLERLTLLQLRINPGQTLAELTTNNGSKDPAYYSRCLRTLVMAGQVVASVVDGVNTYALPVVQQ